MIYSINMHTTVYQFWRFVYHPEQSVIDHYARSSFYTRSFCTAIKLYVGHFLWPRGGNEVNTYNLTKWLLGFIVDDKWSISVDESMNEWMNEWMNAREVEYSKGMLNRILLADKCIYIYPIKYLYILFQLSNELYFDTVSKFRIISIAHSSLIPIFEVRPSSAHPLHGLHL